MITTGGNDVEGKHGPVDSEAVARALSDGKRRAILQAAIGDPRSVRDLSDETGISLSTTYRHVEALEELGLLVKVRSAISEDGKRYDLYRSRLTEMGMRLGPEGVEVTWEVDQAVEDRLARMWEQLRL